MNLPGDKQILLDTIVEELKCIEGVLAIVLGGSYAIGRATANSDLDIGIYYSDQQPFDIEQIKRVAEALSNDEQPTVTGFYEWGPWVNGGAWISTEKGEVDFLYKNINQIAATINNAQNGIWENHFEQQPPYGFSSIIFLAETQYCISLFDPECIIEKLKKDVKEYPKKLQQSVIQQSLWSAEFTIWQAEKFASQSDMYNTLGCLTRAIKSIVTALFAINKIYPMGDKRALEIIEQANTKPSDLTNKVNGILSCTPNALANNVATLRLLFDETVLLADGQYTPYFQL